MSKQDSRAGQLNAEIEPKLLFLARTAARYKGKSLVEFIEDALRLALSLDAVDEDEPTYGPDFKARKDAPLQFERMWVDTGKQHKDAAARLFLVAREDINLVAPKQRALFHHIITELTKQGKKVTRSNFVNFIDYSESGE
jgi:hypothetical protein